ncbi:MAG: hypothetical protein ABID79_01280 [Elusimicrobiota bacterium]
MLDTQIIVAVISIVVMLIVLGKISRQLDSIIRMLEYIEKEEDNIKNTTEWKWEIIKAKLDILTKEVEEEIEGKKGSEKEINWQG